MDSNAETSGDIERREAENRELTRSNDLQEKREAEIRESARTEMLVAAIITTVTFAAGFNMPGGYISVGPDQGKAFFTRKTAFQSFLICDSIAFCFSATSLFCYFLTSATESYPNFIDLIRWIRRLTLLSVIAMVIAFISGTNAVLVGSSGLATANIAIGCCFFLSVLALCISFLVR